MSWTPGVVPYGADETVYLVVDSFGALGSVYRETEIERADLETVISDLMTGQFSNPVRVVAFNTLDVNRRSNLTPHRRPILALTHF
jgi:hypothetical protein